MGEYYVDYDETTACWGVFHTDIRPGYCYALFTTQEEAEEWAREQVLWNAAAETEQEGLN